MENEARNSNDELLNPLYAAIDTLITKFENEPTYVGVIDAIDYYFYDEFDLDFVSCNTLREGLAQSGGIPSQDLYDYDLDEFMLRLRLGMYDIVVDLYVDLHDAEDFKVWYPNFIEFVIGDHEQEVDSDCIDEGCLCARCPVNRIRDKVLDDVFDPETRSMEYQYFPEDTIKLSVTKLGSLVVADLVTAEEANNASDVYAKKLSEDITFNPKWLRADDYDA